jgi:hypothetical protein
MIGEEGIGRPVFLALVLRMRTKIVMNRINKTKIIISIGLLLYGLGDSFGEPCETLDL